MQRPHALSIPRSMVLSRAFASSDSTQGMLAAFCMTSQLFNSPLKGLSSTPVVFWVFRHAGRDVPTHTVQLLQWHAASIAMLLYLLLSNTYSDGLPWRPHASLMHACGRISMHKRCLRAPKQSIAASVVKQKMPKQCYFWVVTLGVKTCIEELKEVLLQFLLKLIVPPHSSLFSCFWTVLPCHIGSW